MSRAAETPPERARVGYLGPRGTFTEEALLASAADGAVEAVPQATIYDTVAALRRRDVRWAVVPIENSLEGSINVTLDLLAADAGDVSIAGEALLRVHHCLIAAEPIELADVTTVLTHPQVPGQCTRFLRGELAHARILPAASTAEAVRVIAEGGDRNRAAIGTMLAARRRPSRRCGRARRTPGRRRSCSGASGPSGRDRSCAAWTSSPGARST